ncbi:MAG: hypothetical protein ACO3JL_20450, partial [Myxococcota bacterium]
MSKKPPFSERIRLVRILKTHGVRTAERMRAEELQSAVKKLRLTAELEAELAPDTSTMLENAVAVAVAEPVSSTELVQRGIDEPPPPLEETPFDPIDPRFREAQNFLPSGERTFVRLIAVDWHRLFATWDLGPEARALAAADEAELVITAADGEENDESAVLHRERVRLSSKGWYLPATPARLGVVASLRAIGGASLARSNRVIVPPNHPAPPGELRFATVPVGANRALLRGGALLGALLDDQTELPPGVVIAESGRQVRSPTQDEIGESAPSYGRRRLIT